ncbi:hypothetical protein [Bacillus gaemokensis]|uniref:Uncharacterized protein n=1 Tax=Bacillus gaemokensis TaxID=574375 RepID=A0A073K9D7_9BACI|nr:hypothetical protein [Bacillus gaemokensis]KEK23894.1 hypothetical protein BAGA_05490 [Bacillus gaemokensis]KYG38135.1 hypothetical protein AZF08_20520 [Bacillus gaemokensis]
MRKRQIKKRDNKLFIAIRELNDDLSRDFGLSTIPDDEVLKIRDKIKKSPDKVNGTFRDYGKLRRFNRGCNW